MFDPDLINLPPIKYRPLWLIADHDDTDTDYSADEPEEIVESTKVQSQKTDAEAERDDGSVIIPPGDEVLKEVERPRTDGEHTGVG